MFIKPRGNFLWDQNQNEALSSVITPKDTFMNVTDAYYATVYFVDTAIICNGGRTEEEFNLQGTGDRLSLQNGPINTDLLNVPLNESEIVADVCTGSLKKACSGL